MTYNVCKKCKNDISMQENHFSNMNEQYCVWCFDEITPKERKGFFPVTRAWISDAWKKACEGYGMKV